MESFSLTSSLATDMAQLTHTTRFGRTSESYFVIRLSVRPCSLFFFYYFSIVGDISFFIIDFRNGQRWLKLLNSKKKFGWSKNWFCNFFFGWFIQKLYLLNDWKFIFFFINSYEHLPINRAHISHLWCTQQF